MSDFLRGLIDSDAAKMAGVIVRGVVQRVSEKLKMRELQLKVFDDDDDDEVEHFEPYGFSSRPKEPDSAGAAEAVLGAIGADASHYVAIIVADRRFRPTDLEEGEVIMYDDLGSLVKLSRNAFTDIPGVKAVVLESPGVILLGGEADSSEYNGKGVARLGDSIRGDGAMGIWMGQVQSFINGITPGTVAPTLTNVDGSITTASTKVAARD